MQRLELAQKGRQKDRAGYGAGSDNDVTCNLFTQLVKVSSETGLFLPHSLSETKQSLPGISQSDCLLSSVYQANAKIALQLLNLKRHSRLADGQLLSYLGEAAQLDHFKKGFQILYIHA